MGRDIQVRSAASAEHVREIESFVNGRIAEVEGMVKGGDPQVVAILALMNLAESYLSIEGHEGRSGGLDGRIRTLLDRLDEI